MEEIIRLENQFYILTSSSLVDDRTRVLKHGDTFAVFDRYGDIQPVGRGGQGLYHEGTRYLSLCTLRLGKDRPLLLSSTVKEDNILFTVDLANPDFDHDGQVTVPRGSIHLFRTKFLWKGICYERLRLSNFGLTATEVALSLNFESDFVDIFEVRGMQRDQRGRLQPAEHTADSLLLSYEGLDGVVRRTRIESTPPPERIDDSTLFYRQRLGPKAEVVLWISITCEAEAKAAASLSFDGALEEANEQFVTALTKDCDIQTTNGLFNAWLRRSLADLHMMVTRTREGLYPYAGVPWFSTVFGRDGLISSLQSLWVNPNIAQGVLKHLAATQAKETIPECDAEPGKILHESRVGEMAALKEIPFGHYYGSVDATPLFVILAGAYFARTGDRALLESLWPNIELALTWMDRYGDVDGDGFVEYVQRARKGLLHQGWKDSQDSVFHSDGTLAEGPIALCEVQGYVYAAKRAAADLATALGHPERADALLRQAAALRDHFEAVFWCDDLGTYALALDGKKKPCRVRTSNAGHCLFAGIASPERARRVADTLFAESSFSGWGIRTVDASEVRYNPMSYHNGSVWPHDNALIAAGLARYGFKDGVVKILGSLFDCSTRVDLNRLPELICGFRRRANEGPTPYPVACAPQAWSAATVFMLIQSCLGLSIHSDQNQISFSHPMLPEFLEEVRIRNLRVGKASLDLRAAGRGEDTDITILKRTGPVEVVLFK